MAQKWTSIKQPWTIKDIGAPLLDTVARGLYSPLDILREYSQNAIDSYVDYAVLTGGESPLRTVQIRIDRENAAVMIHDNGVGMDKADVQNAKSIAVSQKLRRSQEFVGFRGIGIWSGLAACDRLEIVTTKVNDPHEYKLEIDCKGIVEHVEEPISVDLLLENRFDIYERETTAESHYTTVKLVNVHRERYADLLDRDGVMRYIGQVLPVPFDPAWEYATELQEMLKDVPWTQTWDVTVDGEPVYRRFPQGQLKKPTLERITIRNGGDEQEVATAWVAETNRITAKKQLDPDTKRGEVVGFAVRVKSFTLGDRDLYADATVEDRDNLDWFVGEVLLIDPDLRPDSNRRALQQSDKSRRVIEAIQKFYSRVAVRARGWSEEVSVRKAAADLAELLKEVEETLSVEPGKKSRKVSSRLSREQNDTLTAAMSHALQANSKITEANKGSRKNSTQSLRENAIKTYLIKPEVKAILTEADGHFKRIQELVKQHAPAAAKAGQESATSTRKKGAGKRATKRSRSRSSKTSTADNSDTNLVDLDTAKAAFLAAVAAVVGPNSDAFKRITARLDEELRRRGIGVKAA
jgi:hypothetical protein